VESGSATAVVVHTGAGPTLARWPPALSGSASSPASIWRQQVHWLMIRFIAVMVPLVFLINGLSKHNWLEAFLFAMAVAVGLTPRCCP